MRSIACYKVGIDEQFPELGRALEHADVCVSELQLDRIRRQSMTFQRHR